MDAQHYIDQWRTLSFIAGGMAAVGASIGMYGAAKAWAVLRAVRNHPRKTLAYVAWGDVILLAVLSAAAVVQVLTSIGLILISDKYPIRLSQVLAVLDGSITTVYVGYVVQVAIVNLGAPVYLAIRALALLEEEWREMKP